MIHSSLSKVSSFLLLLTINVFSHVLFKQWPDTEVGTKCTSVYLKYVWTTYK